MYILSFWYLFCNIFFNSDNKDVVAQMSVLFDKANVDKGRSLDNAIDHKEEVEKILKDTISTGQFGALKVHPTYLVFEPQSCKYLLSNLF